VGSPVVADGHLGDDRKIRERAHRFQSGAELLDVAERFQNKAVDAALEQSPRLPGKIGARLFDRSLAERLDADAERADGADHSGAAAGRAARYFRRGAVDALGIVGEAVLRQLARVSAEGIRLQQLRAGPHILAVDLAYQLVEADVEEHAPAIEHRSHRPVTDVGAAVGNQLPEIHRSYPRFGASQRSASARLSPWRRA